LIGSYGRHADQRLSTTVTSDTQLHAAARAESSYTYAPVQAKNSLEARGIHEKLLMTCARDSQGRAELSVVDW